MAQKKYLDSAFFNSKIVQFVFCAVLSTSWMCKNGTEGLATQQVIQSDSLEIARCIHGFYEWYSHFVKDSQSRVDFVEDDGVHYRLSSAKLDAYLQKLAKCQFVSHQLIQQQSEMYLKCEQLWQKESNQDVPSCMDGDPLFCAQEWDIQYWTQSPVKIDYIRNDSVEVSLEGLSFHSPLIRKFILLKEVGGWKIASVRCDMESATITPVNDTILIDSAWVSQQTKTHLPIRGIELSELSVADFQDSIDVHSANYYIVDTLYYNEAGKVLILIKTKGEERTVMMVQYSSSNKMVYWEILFYESIDHADARISTAINGENIVITTQKRDLNRWKRRTNVYRLSERNIFERI
ncbi:MAG: YbjP/YqhG family protein [Saprospiraceae bacterium]|nr:YbjP/YqhG family protein [Saprospiraceae bacterium]MBX7176564.1 YbjP/YqhG family protein [Saprospiraceae bacterium]HMW39020.1 DUF3828 domain-containing protein [Saprospiraceae bacterium]HMX87045.1 DUF3828 domain-containing protein [Saprospiraceae bacterium]HMZ41242.1 DUF3828 domain-containing protein [Saprospiraceae bacterium]